MSLQLANAGKEAIEKKTKAHRDAIRTRGYGTHYGDHSSYTPPAGASLTESSCVVWAMECAAYAFEKVGQQAKWAEISRATKRDQLKGTTLAKELRNRSAWTGIYWNPDVRKPSDGDNEHPYSYHLAKTRKSYYGVTISDYVINYRPTAGGPTTKDTTGIDKLAKVPFWIGCARGGMHVFCGTGKHVSEFHWDYPATDPNAMELVELTTYGWLSGIIMVPNGVWALASR